MTGIESWSTTAASNNASPPNGAPEGMAPSTVNNTMRQMMAATRTWYETAQWINLGYTHTYVGATQFKISGQDLTAIYSVGRKVRAVGTSTGTIYGYISVSAFSTDTTLTVVWVSGSLSNEALTISVGILTPTSSALPHLTDSVTFFQDNADPTKKLQFQLSGITTGTIRTLTVPDTSDTIVGLTATQSPTNKTFDNTNTATLKDSNFTLQDNSDATKTATFELAGLATSTAAVLPITNSSGYAGSTNSDSSGAGADVNHTPNYSIPASYLTAGKILRVTAMFRMNTSGTPPTIIFKLKAGSTALFTHTAVTPANSLVNNSIVLQWFLVGGAAPGASAATYTSMVSIPSGFATGSGALMNATAQPVNLATNGPLTLQVATLLSSDTAGTNNVTLDAFSVEATN